MSNKEGVMSLIEQTQGHRNLSANECERFGMEYGCRPDCPVFERGECKDSFFVNLEMFINDKEYYQEDAIEIIEIYSDKLDSTEKEYLIQLSNELKNYEQLI